MATPLLAARGINKSFGGVHAVRNVDLEVMPGTIQCLAGENGCGKSTLIKVISGVERPDSGTIEVDGAPANWSGPRDAIRAGIQVIYQDFSLFPNLTVAENIGVTSLVAENRTLYNSKVVRERAEAVLARLGIHLDLDARVEELTVADRQLTAICRSLAEEARVIFMDEPTTALTRREVTKLFEVVRSIQEQGVATVFVSHKLEEVLEIAEYITVMRNGRVVAAGPTSEFDRYSLASAMTGRDVRDTRDEVSYDETAGPVLETRNLTLPGRFEDVSFQLRPGEILGITGLLGSGRSEIAEALFGATPAASGQILVHGQPVRIRSIDDAVDAGIGYVPADRLLQGLFLDQSIADNVISASLDRHRGTLGLLDRKRLRDTIATYFAKLRIQAPSPKAAIRSLSGGNQQRVVIAKWLARGPKVMILNSPTVGVDVGSKEEILEILRDQARSGVGVIIVSDDVPELVAVCNRVIVIRKGRVHDILAGERVTDAVILEGLTA